MPDYKLELRNPKTLSLLGFMPQYESVWWKRRAVEAGEFSVTAHKQDIAVALIPRLTVLEIRRDNVFEFAGVIENREYNAVSQTWTLSGRDPKGFFLSSRHIDPGASEFDTQAGVVAETAMKHYVTDHLVAPSDASRKIGDELTGIDFTVEGTHGFGLVVNKNARWEELRSVLTELAHKGGVVHDVVIKPNYMGYEYQVRKPVDATEGTGTTPVIFGIAWENVGEATYVEHYTSIVNAMYVLGQGQGAARTVREVKDAASITDDFRREGHLDARSSDTNDKLDMAGEVAISQSLLDALTARMNPLTVGPTQYRTNWDLGYDVTVAFNDIGVTLDRRIEEVTVTLESEEQVSIGLGARPPEIGKLVAETLRRMTVAQVE